MSSFPETMLQFGTGRFLRAFADRFIHQANVEGLAIGSVAVVQSTGTDAADQLNAARGVYHIAVRGLENGQTVRRDEVASVSRCLAASRDWDEVLKVAQSPDLRFILSNSTEKGYTLDPNDGPKERIPHSFPAKLLAVLEARFESGVPPVTLIPCELRDNQADELRTIVVGLARQRRFAEDLLEWIETRCIWLNTLVDRIVVGPPSDHPLSGKDPLLVMAEPFAFWALQSNQNAYPFVVHPAIVRCPDVRPYFLRKVRILNAAHTALVTRAKPRGHVTVLQAMNDRELAEWLERLLFDEIVPALPMEVEGAEEFARQTLERFRNTFLAHKIDDIRQNHDSKVRIRLLPTRDEFRAKFNREPVLLNTVLKENGL
jgi:tagaturonate reductase